MAANSIGNASLILSSNGSGLLSGLGNSLSGIKSWGDKAQTSVASSVKAISNKVSTSLSAAKSILGGAGTAIGTALGGPIGAVIGGAVGSAAGGIVESIFGAITEPFDKLDLFAKINKQAQTLGISASQFQGLTQVMAKAGIEGDAVSQTFALMGKNVADAAGGHGRAAPALKQLGIDAQALLSLPIDKQFMAIGDAINQLPPGAEQASAALHIFGGQGAALLPVLQRGGKGIQDFIEQQKKVGAVLGDSQLKAAADASKAWKESKFQISSVWDGLVNRATLIAAPIVKFVAGVVSKAFNLLTPLFDWMNRGIQQVSEILTAVFEVFGGWIDEAIGWLKDIIGQIFGFGDSWMTIQDVVKVVLKTLAQMIGYVWDTLKAGVGVMAQVYGFIIKGMGDVVDVFKEDIKEMLNIAGTLPDDLGGKWFRDQAKEVDKWGAAIRKTGGDMEKWGKGAVGSWGNSADRIGAWFDKLGQKKQKLDQVMGGKGEESTPAKYTPVAAALKDSKEAYSIEARWRTEAMLNPAGKKIEEKNNDELKKVNGKLEKMITIWGQNIPLVAG